MKRYVSLKSRDAQLLLERMKLAISEPWRPHQPGFQLDHTIFLERLLNDIALENTRGALGLSPASDEDPQMMERLRRAALLRVVAREQGRLSGWEPTEVEMTDRAAALWSALGVKNSGTAVRWMTRHGVSEQMLRGYLSDELHLARLANLQRGRDRTRVGARVSDQPFASAQRGRRRLRCARRIILPERMVGVPRHRQLRDITAAFPIDYDEIIGLGP